MDGGDRLRVRPPRLLVAVVRGGPVPAEAVDRLDCTDDGRFGDGCRDDVGCCNEFGAGGMACIGGGDPRFFSSDGTVLGDPAGELLASSGFVDADDDGPSDASAFVVDVAALSDIVSG